MATTSRTKKTKSSQQWAWEFLRRNPDYRDAFRKLVALSPVKLAQIGMVADGAKDHQLDEEVVRALDIHFFDTSVLTGYKAKQKTVGEYIDQSQRIRNSLNETEIDLAIATKFRLETYSLVKWYAPEVELPLNDVANMWHHHVPFEFGLTPAPWAEGNGIEAATRRYQHRPCIVDEIGQGSGKGFDKAAYALTNAAGKLRADTSGNLQESSRNYAMVMSAGEVSAITRMRKSGLTVQDGQKARLPSLKVNGKHGLWDNVRGYGSGAEKSKAITSMLNGCYGHAGAALCEHLVQQLPSLHADYAKIAPKLRDHLVKGLTFDEKDGVFDRMRENFVLFTFAGLMAVDAKAVWWSKQQVMDAIAHSFSQWYTDHLQSQPITDHAVMNHLRLFFQSQRGDKFKPFEQFTDGHKGTVAGYEHAGRAKSEPLFLVFPSYFENVVCKGLDLQTVLSVLRGQELLVSGSRNVPTKQFHLPGTDNRNVSFYAIKQAILLD